MVDGGCGRRCRPAAAHSPSSARQASRRSARGPMRSAGGRGYRARTPRRRGRRGRPARPGRPPARGRAPRGRSGQRPAHPTDPPVRQRAGGGDFQNRAMADVPPGCGGAAAKRPSRWQPRHTSRGPFGEVVVPPLRGRGCLRARGGGEGRAAGWGPALPKPPAYSLRIGTEASRRLRDESIELSPPRQYRLEVAVVLPYLCLVWSPGAPACPFEFVPRLRRLESPTCSLQTAHLAPRGPGWHEPSR